jgi:hypothetical protein
LSSQSRTLTPSIAECREELQAVLASTIFQHSQRLARLLQYVCSKAVLGEAEQVTEYTIAVDVFGKPEGFRESKDSIVRVEVHRLRKRLADYYGGAGADHRLRIVIPPGSYAPDFQACSTAGDGSTPPHEPVIAESKEPVKPARRNGSIAALPPVVDADTVILPEPAGSLHWPYVVLGAVVLVAMIAAGAVWAVRSHVSAVAPPKAQFIPAINTDVHILAGFTGSPWTDGAGRRWQPDRYFKGGISQTGPADFRAAPPDRRLFQTMREAASDELPEDRQAFSYDIPMQAGVYDLRLYFADPLKDSPALKDGEDEENVRRFTIHLNGRPLLEQFDAVSDEGEAQVDVRAFKDIAPASDGKVHIQFFPEPHRPFVNAIELVPSRAGHYNPVRVAARESSFTDTDGKIWRPDNYFIRGRLVQHGIPESAGGLPELFRAERYGNFAYSVPVPPGSYTLTLYFAETIFSPLAPSSLCRGPGCRVFDVTCNGVSLLRDFDVFEAAGGGFRPVVRTFHSLHPNGQGKLLVAFSPSTNYAEVRALEVVDEAP